MNAKATKREVCAKLIVLALNTYVLTAGLTAWWLIRVAGLKAGSNAAALVTVGYFLCFAAFVGISLVEWLFGSRRKLIANVLMAALSALAVGLLLPYIAIA